MDLNNHENLRAYNLALSFGLKLETKEEAEKKKKDLHDYMMSNLKRVEDQYFEAKQRLENSSDSEREENRHTFLLCEQLYNSTKANKFYD